MMKITKDAAGVDEAQAPECVPDGPIRLAPSVPDTRKRVHKDGSEAKGAVERPTYAGNPIGMLRDRIAFLETEVGILRSHFRTDPHALIFHDPDGKGGYTFLPRETVEIIDRLRNDVEALKVQLDRTISAVTGLEKKTLPLVSMP